MNRDFKKGIAYTARNRTSIMGRWIKSIAFRASRKLMSKAGQKIEEISSLTCYPPVEDLEKAADLYNRLNWYFNSEGVKVYLPTSHTQASIQEKASDLTHQPSYHRNSEIVQVDNPSNVRSRLDDTDLILVWDASTLLSLTILQRLGRVWIIDPEFYSVTECSTYLKLLQLSQKPLDDQRNIEKFHTFLNQYRKTQEAYIFATGPSLDTTLEAEIPNDAMKVICNSIVRSDELLSHIQPDVLTFADPVFHFGPSRYAHQFRLDAIKTIKRYGCWCIVPSPKEILLKERYPEVSDKIIGIPSLPENSRFNFPNINRFYVRSTSNIMTLLMLPIASTVGNTIKIIGADGRSEDESYFWEHSNVAQYGGLMNSVAQSHPSFFRDRLYTDYYRLHTERIRNLIEFGENQGKQYISVTPSYIPALRERHVDK